jgi:hypothetical protein
MIMIMMLTLSPLLLFTLQVDRHEAYYSMIRGRVEVLRPLLQKISRREVIAQERIELEHIQMNPERLSARGPNAREDRKREEGMHTRVKGLEKMTRELMAQIAQWEAENGQFLYGGEVYSERVAKQEESYIEIRDSLRNSRKKKDGKAEARPIAPALPGQKKSVFNGSLSASTSSFNTAASKGAGLSKEAVDAQDGQENLPRNSTGSDGTEFTSATLVKERSSSFSQAAPGASRA